MGIVNLGCGAKIYPAKIIKAENGQVMRAIKSSDLDFCGFGEAYFSTIEHGATKGWKKHLRMTMNIFVPVGKIRFYLKLYENQTPEVVILGVNDYRRLYVPAGVWMAFEGIGEQINILLNVASIEHDPLESISANYMKS